MDERTNGKSVFISPSFFNRGLKRGIKWEKRSENRENRGKAREKIKKLGENGSKNGKSVNKIGGKREEYRSKSRGKTN